ncbi:MAG TPA: GNAT family N-acetyltransferase [Allosphingosinicella sp.]
MSAVRPFEPADAEAVNAAALAAFAQYRGVYSDWETLERGVGSMAALAEMAEIVVAEDGGELLGAVAYCAPFSEPRAEFFAAEWPLIRMLVVRPEARGRGIGRALTDACIERARRDRAGAIALHTSPAMEVALAMYLRMGFTLLRRVPDRFGVPYGVYLKPIEPLDVPA